MVAGTAGTRTTASQAKIQTFLIQAVTCAPGHQLRLQAGQLSGTGFRMTLEGQAAFQVILGLTPDSWLCRHSRPNVNSKWHRRLRAKPAFGRLQLPSPGPPPVNRKTHQGRVVCCLRKCRNSSSASASAPSWRSCSAYTATNSGLLCCAAGMKAAEPVATPPEPLARHSHLLPRLQQAPAPSLAFQSLSSALPRIFRRRSGNRPSRADQSSDCR